MPPSSEPFAPHSPAVHHHHPHLVALLACTCMLIACARQAAPDAAAASSPVIALTLAREDNTPFAFPAAQAGHPTLLFLFATYDTASQLALAHLERFLAHDKRIAVLGLSLQPDAPSFLKIYRDALSVDFPLAYDPEGVVLQGKSDLGRIDAVPAFLLIDGEGHVRAKRYGVATEDELHDLVEGAL